MEEQGFCGGSLKSQGYPRETYGICHFQCEPLVERYRSCKALYSEVGKEYDTAGAAGAGAAGSGGVAPIAVVADDGSRNGDASSSSTSAPLLLMVMACCPVSITMFVS